MTRDNKNYNSHNFKLIISKSTNQFTYSARISHRVRVFGLHGTI